MTVPFAFANLSGNIALAKLDSNFNTPITIGNTSVLLGNTITTINNVTLANVTISSGTVSNISFTSPLAVSSGGTGSANLTVNNVLIGNGTSAVTSVAPGTTGNVLTSIGGAWVSNVAMSGAASGSNTQVQYNNSGALAGSANLTFNGTTLTANTLNLTNALGTTYGGTGLTSFASGGVVYASSSSALTTGSALTFDGTTLYTSASVRGGGGFTFAGSSVGSAVGPTLNGGYSTGGSRAFLQGYDWTASAFIPVAFSGTNLQFQISGSEQMRLTSTGLGIGTSSPGYPLHVYGNSNIVSISAAIQNAGTSDVGLRFIRGSTSLGFIGNGSFVVSGGSSTDWGFNATNNMLFAINASEKMRLDSSGNLGIGTSSPNASAILDAQSTTKGVRMPNMTTTEKNAISSPAAGLMVFDTTLAKLCVYTGAAWQTITSV